MNSLTQNILDRFWGKVDKENSTVFYNGARCWEWTAARSGYGYGVIGIEGESFYAHRLSYTINFGGFQNNLLVLHHCDNPPCVNPVHLFLGTTKDNIVDKVSKGRQHHPCGEKSGMHKLTDKQVNEIRKRYKRFGVGESSSAYLAQEFGVTRNHILAIMKGIRRNKG